MPYAAKVDSNALCARSSTRETVRLNHVENSTGSYLRPRDCPACAVASGADIPVVFAARCLRELSQALLKIGASGFRCVDGTGRRRNRRISLTRSACKAESDTDATYIGWATLRDVTSGRSRHRPPLGNSNVSSASGFISMLYPGAVGGI